MHIPRQSDRSRARGVGRLDGAAELRTRRRHLVTELRGVGYWQRLVQARTDLQVAGLLYSAPVPATADLLRWSVRAVGQQLDLTTLAAPPEGVDVEGLFGSPCPQGPGAQLERLRQVALVLLRRNRALQEELDTVTEALHAWLARDRDGAGLENSGSEGSGVEDSGLEGSGTGAPVPAPTTWGSPNGTRVRHPA